MWLNTRRCVIALAVCAYAHVFTIEASMGRNRVVVAVLLEHSVNVATSRLSSMEMAKGGIFCSGVSLSPNHVDKPDFCWQIFSSTKDDHCGKKIRTGKGAKNFTAQIIIFCV